MQRGAFKGEICLHADLIPSNVVEGLLLKDSTLYLPCLIPIPVDLPTCAFIIWWNKSQWMANFTAQTLILALNSRYHSQVKRPNSKNRCLKWNIGTCSFSRPILYHIRGDCGVELNKFHSPKQLSTVLRHRLVIRTFTGSRSANQKQECCPIVLSSTSTAVVSFGCLPFS